MADANEAKKKALQLTLDKLDKTYGKGAVMKLGDEAVEEVEAISSGSIGLDLALGVGGYPRGRVVEIYGPESSGKTTLTLHAIAECQKAGGIAAFIDAEHAFDRFYAEKLGIDVSELIISQPDHGEQALEIADNLIRSGAIDIVVVDSVAALTPKSEIEGEMGDSKMGLHARLMSQALRKLTASISKTNCTVFFINQLREKIGVMFGNPETTTGGNALKFYASRLLPSWNKPEVLAWLKKHAEAVCDLADAGDDAVASAAAVRLIRYHEDSPDSVFAKRNLLAAGVLSDFEPPLPIPNDLLDPTAPPPTAGGQPALEPGTRPGVINPDSNVLMQMLQSLVPGARPPPQEDA